MPDGPVSQGSLSRAPAPDQAGLLSCKGPAILRFQPAHTALGVWLYETLVSSEVAMCEILQRDPHSCQACQLYWNVLSSWDLRILISESIVIFP